jgi:sugar O-acyltransferase (sialic acid O-acetyltransferase NeuD family)
MKKKAVIFGTGTLAELVDFYLTCDSGYEVVAFCSENPESNSFCGKMLIDFESVESHFSPKNHEMFVAIGYRKMNSLRKDFCEQARAKGYKLLSYISSKATYWDKANKIGDNVFIFEDNTIQPFVEIGDGVVMWSGNHIGHHSNIGSYSFLTSHVVISGFCNIGEQNFLGVNSTIVDGTITGNKSLIGAGALVNKKVLDNQVVVAPKGIILDKKSEYFLR